MSVNGQNAVSAPGSGFLGRLGDRLDGWRDREWFSAGLAALIVLLLLAELIRVLLPGEQVLSQEVAIVADLQNVEFEEIQVQRPAESQDLSDQIIEKEKKEKLKEINWENAPDPMTDIFQKYKPEFDLTVSEDDYPEGARRSNLGTVKVFCTVGVGADGRVRYVRIRRMRSQGNAHKPFEAEFMRAARNVLLRARLTTRPYLKDGVPTAFKWDMSFDFILR